MLGLLRLTWFLLLLRNPFLSLFENSVVHYHEVRRRNEETRAFERKSRQHLPKVDFVEDRNSERKNEEAKIKDWSEVKPVTLHFDRVYFFVKSLLVPEILKGIPQPANHVGVGDLDCD